MPWSHPAARMRELIVAIRAIWDCWRIGTPLRFRGEFYTHTLMTPFFAPTAVRRTRRTAADRARRVGPDMTTVAGEVGDGIICHPLTTERYLREVTLPALQRAEHGAARHSTASRSRASFVVTGSNDAEVAVAERATRQQMAFYASTPAYRPVLERHGWGELQTDLNRLSKAGDWTGMGELVDDEMLARSPSSPHPRTSPPA